MRVTFIVGGQIAVELILQIDPDPNNIRASLVNEINTAFHQRAELAAAGPVYAVTWAADNFGSQDDLEMGDVELGETFSIVIWASRRLRRRVARTVKQVVEVAMFKDLVREREQTGPPEGPRKRIRLTEAGEHGEISAKAFVRPADPRAGQV